MKEWASSSNRSTGLYMTPSSSPVTDIGSALSVAKKRLEGKLRIVRRTCPGSKLQITSRKLSGVGDPVGDHVDKRDATDDFFSSSNNCRIVSISRSATDREPEYCCMRGKICDGWQVLDGCEWNSEDVNRKTASFVFESAIRLNCVCCRILCNSLLTLAGCEKRSSA